MNKISLRILRVGLAITFLWIGVMIFRTPEAWGGYIQPWAAKLLPVPVAQAMLGAAVFDIVVGVLLLFGWFVWFAAMVAALHIALVLIISGITDFTVRDVGLLAASLALAVESLPKTLADKLRGRGVE